MRVFYGKLTPVNNSVLAEVLYNNGKSDGDTVGSWKYFTTRFASAPSEKTYQKSQKWLNNAVNLANQYCSY
jgi:hypothetical protein